MSEKFLIKLNHFSAWALLILTILFIISGYGMTKQIINPTLATILHNNLLPIPFFIFFFLHAGISIRFAFKRWGLFQSERAIDIFVAICSLILLISFLWLFF